MTLPAPTVHLNGTPRARLLGDVCDAGRAVRAALDAMAAAAPNARDYYPQGPDAFRAAAAAHDSRVARLRSVLAEYEALAEAIADAP